MGTQPRVIKRWANDSQRWLVERGAAPTLLAGGVNSGKTVGAVLKALALLHKYPGSRIAVVRRSYTQLLKTTMETWYQWCTPQMYKPNGNRTEGVLDLNNGSRVYFIHLDQPNSLDLLAGLELNFAYVSQVEEIEMKAWDLLDVRVGRWKGATVPQEEIDAVGGLENWPWKNEEGEVVPPRYLFAEGYVTDEGHWLYDRFAEDSPNREKWAAQGYEGKIIWSEDNVYAIQATIQASLKKDDDYVRRYVRPEWGNPEGRIFYVSAMSKLEYSPWLVERIMRTMKLHRSLDHGEYVATVCGWHATDSDGNIFTYREYYKENDLVSNHRRVIFEMSKADGFNGASVPRYHSQLADPSIFNENRGRSVDTRPTWSVADEYTDTRMMDRETVIRWTAAENDEQATRSRMKEYLKIDPNHRHPVTGRLGAPHLYFVMKGPEYSQGCDKIVKQVNAQQRVRAKIGDREIFLDQRDEKIVDHGYDMEKYFVCSRPSLGPMVAAPLTAPGEIRVSDYDAATNYTRSRKRFEERKNGVGFLGYGY